MATNEQIIKALFVSLGFKLDRSSEREFTRVLDVTTVGAIGLGSAVAGAAVAVEAAVYKMASNFEKLFYKSKLFDSTAQNFQTLEYGAKQVGASVEAAVGGMARAIRSNPGLKSFLESIIGPTGAKQGTESVVKMMQQLSKLPDFIGQQYANMLTGMDSDTYLLLKQGLPDMIRFREKANALLQHSGLDLDRVAEKSKNFMQNVRALTFDLTMVGEKVFSDLIDQHGDAVNRLINWVEKPENFDRFANNIEKVVNNIMRLASGIDDVAKALGGWENVAAGGGILLLLRLLLGLFGTGAAGGLAVGVAGIAGLTAWLAGKGYGTPGGTSAPAAAPSAAPSDDRYPLTGSWVDGFRVAANEARYGKSRATRNHNPGNLKYGDFAKRYGATGADSAGFAIFPNRGAGEEAAENLLDSYFQQGHRTISDIIHKWSPDANADAYTNYVSKRTGYGANQQLGRGQVDFMLLPAMASFEAGRLGAEGAATMAGNTHVNQTNNFHIDGSKSPHETADAVKSALNRSNADLGRNGKSAVDPRN